MPSSRRYQKLTPQQASDPMNSRGYYCVGSFFSPRQRPSECKPHVVDYNKLAAMLPKAAPRAIRLVMAMTQSKRPHHDDYAAAGKSLPLVYRRFFLFFHLFFL